MPRPVHPGGDDEWLETLREGDWDKLREPFADRCFGCADALPEQRGHDLINRYATAFLETYVTKDERYAHYLREDVAPDAAIVHDAAYGP